MTEISKEVFKEMKILGLIKEFHIKNKRNESEYVRNFYVANRRNAKSKTYYVESDVYEDYIKYL